MDRITKVSWEIIQLKTRSHQLISQQTFLTIVIIIIIIHKKDKNSFLMYIVEVTILLSKLINHSMLLEVINMDNWELGISKLTNKNYQSKLIATLRMKQFSDKFNVDTSTV